MKEIAGKTVLIIGASRGIGAAAAQAFAREGTNLVLAARDVAAMESLAHALPAPENVRVIRTDISCASDIIRSVDYCAEQFGRLDIAFNNAGVTQKRVPFAEMTDEVFDAVMNVNVRAIFVAMKRQIALMLQTGGGAIVNTGSMSSTVVMPQMGAYCTSKHALAGMTKIAALDYAARNIRVNLIAPGPVETAMFQGGIGATKAGRDAVTAATPMRRIASPEEVAEAVVWLASPAASYITGAIVPIDGGITLA
jgi:NAD(P)-dependent dehydrogenase (short-subunit alcohol dehydrogenase family)